MEDVKKKIFHGSHTLKEAGHRLRLGRECICSAHVYYHKFAESTQVFDVDLTAAASIWIAIKVHEEHEVKLRDVVNVFYNLNHPDKEPLDDGIIYWSLRDAITAVELVVLRVLQFKVVYAMPHKYLIHFTKSLSEWMNCTQDEKTLFARVSWSLVNDFFTCPLVLKYIENPETLAIAVMQLSLKECGLEVPGEGVWEEGLKKGVDHVLLEEMKQDIMKSYAPFINGSCW